MTRYSSLACGALCVRSAILLCATFIMADSPVGVAAQRGTQTIDLSVDDPRPVAKGVQQLVERYGYAITYEDPRYSFAGELQDISAEVHQDMDKQLRAKAPKVLIPVGGNLSLHVAVPASPGVHDMAAVVDRLLAAHAVSDQGGRFRVELTGKVLHVVPTGTKDLNGNWVEQQSVLATRISLAAQERSALEALESLCAAVGVTEHTQVLVGTIPGRLLLETRGVISADDETARAVLLRIIASTGENLSWRLLYDAGLHLYALNLAVVPEQAATETISVPKSPANATQSPPVQRPQDPFSVAPR